MTAIRTTALKMYDAGRPSEPRSSRFASSNWHDDYTRAVQFTLVVRQNVIVNKQQNYTIVFPFFFCYSTIIGGVHLRGGMCELLTYKINGLFLL